MATQLTCNGVRDGRTICSESRAQNSDMALPCKGSSSPSQSPSSPSSPSSSPSQSPSSHSPAPSPVPPGPPLKKRADYLSWEDYFMAVAFLSAQRSKDPNSQVGACIVNAEHKIVGIGYNGMPNNCSDDELPWQREAEDRLDTKYLYVCHAELNAILNKNASDVKGCTMYVALFPCNECAKLVIQSGVREVVYLSDKYHNKPEMVASRRLLDMARVKCRYMFLMSDEKEERKKQARQYIPNRRTITIDFSCLDQAVYDIV